MSDGNQDPDSHAKTLPKFADTCNDAPVPGTPDQSEFDDQFGIDKVDEPSITRICTLLTIPFIKRKHLLLLEECFDRLVPIRIKYLRKLFSGNFYLSLFEK